MWSKFTHSVVLLVMPAFKCKFGYATIALCPPLPSLGQFTIADAWPLRSSGSWKYRAHVTNTELEPITHAIARGIIRIQGGSFAMNNSSFYWQEWGWIVFVRAKTSAFFDHLLQPCLKLTFVMRMTVGRGTFLPQWNGRSILHRDVRTKDFICLCSWRASHSF